MASVLSLVHRRALFGSSGTSGEQIDESANRPEIFCQCFAAALVERCNQLLDGLADGFFDLFVFNFAFSCEAIWFLQPGQRNQSRSGRQDAEFRSRLERMATGVTGRGPPGAAVCYGAQDCRKGAW